MINGVFMEIYYNPIYPLNVLWVKKIIIDDKIFIKKKNICYRDSRYKLSRYVIKIKNRDKNLLFSTVFLISLVLPGN